MPGLLVIVAMIWSRNMADPTRRTTQAYAKPFAPGYPTGFLAGRRYCNSDREHRLRSHKNQGDG